MQSTSAYLPLWGAGELAALSQAYIRSVNPYFTEIVPDNVKLLTYMQDTLHTLDSLGDMHQKYGREQYKALSTRKLLRRIATDGVDRTVMTKRLETRLKRSPTTQEVDDKMQAYTAELEGATRLYNQGWELHNIDYDGSYAIWSNKTSKKTYVTSFDHYSLDKSNLKENLSNPTSDDAVVFKQITFSKTGNEDNDRFNADTGNGLPGIIDKHTNGNQHEVRFTGYSLGGYATKFWGSRFNIDHDVINVHIFPQTEFAATPRLRPIFIRQRQTKHHLSTVCCLIIQLPPSTHKTRTRYTR